MAAKILIIAPAAAFLIVIAISRPAGLSLMLYILCVLHF